MNKIKVLYDVVKVMRDKDAYSGVLDVAVNKDGAEVLQFRNEFSKDLNSGWTKARVTTAVDHQGKQLKHESSTEFNKGNGDDRHCGPCGYFQHRRHRHFHKNHACMHGHGVKVKLDHLMAVLNALNNLKVVEQPDKRLLLSLDLTDIPEELKQNIQQRIMQKHHGMVSVCQGACSMESGTLECLVNHKYEVETIKVRVNGKLSCEDDESHAMACQANISFSW